MYFTIDNILFIKHIEERPVFCLSHKTPFRASFGKASAALWMAAFCYRRKSFENIFLRLCGKTYVHIYKFDIYARSINFARYLVMRKQLTKRCSFLLHCHSKSRADKVKNISRLTLLRTRYNDAWKYFKRERENERRWMRRKIVKYCKAWAMRQLFITIESLVVSFRTLFL